MCRDPSAVVLRQVFHALALGEILPDQAVGVFVGPAFTSVVRRREIKPGVGRAVAAVARCLIAPDLPQDHAPMPAEPLTVSLMILP